MKRVLVVLTLALMGLLASCSGFTEEDLITALTATPNSGEAALKVRFEVKVSEEAVFGAKSVKCKFDFGDGSEGSVSECHKSQNSSTTHTYTAPGTYKVKMTLSIEFALASTEQSKEVTVTVTGPPTFALILTKSGTGSGTVTSEDGKINCGSDCQESYPKSTPASVKLTATPAADSVFVGWSSPAGDLQAAECTGSNPVITVLMDKAKTCDARFDKRPLSQLLEFLRFKELVYRVEAVAALQNANLAVKAQANPEVAKTLVVAGFDNPGKLEFLDFTDPKNPLPAYEPLDFFCPGTRSLTFVNNSLIPGPYFLAFSTSQRRACGNGIPAGFTQLFNLAYAPGAAVPVPGASLVAVSDFERGQLGFLSLGSKAPAAIPLSGTERSCPFSLLMPNNSTAYVVGREGLAGTTTENCNKWRKLFIVDIPGQTVQTVDLGTKPREIALSPDGKTAYITDFEEDKVYVVDLVAKAVSKTLSVGDGPFGLAVTPAGKLLVGVWNSNKVQLVDPATGSILDEKDTGGIHPAKLLLVDGGQTLIVPHFGSDGDPVKGTGVSFFKVN